MNCLCCGGEAPRHTFRVLEVQTLHIRDLSATDKRVQALGRFQDYAVCGDCAAAYLAAVRRPGGRSLRKGLIFGGVLLLGLAFTAAFWAQGGPLRLLGLAGLACGGLGVFSVWRDTGEQKAAYAALTQEEALEKAAWECLLGSAPKKSEDSDLTYIPVNDGTLALKNGDLMVLYNLLPGIAKKAHRLLHGLPEEEAPPAQETGKA